MLRRGEENEVVGISIWDSPQSRERFRLSEVEAERRQAMAPFVIEESSGFYVRTRADGSRPLTAESTVGAAVPRAECQE